MAANCRSDLFTQFINVGVPRKIHRYILQVISQEKLVQSEHYQWKAGVYEVEYLIFAHFRLGSIFNRAYGKAGIRNPEPQPETETAPEPELKLRPG